MTKENFINKWAYVYNVKNPYFIADLEAVIATEIAKVKEPQPEPKYPIGGYAPGHYTCRCANCKIEFMGDKRAVQCEPCAVKTMSQPTEQPAKPFDKERFEAMFRAVVASGVSNNEFITTEEILEELDAYYATKEKGCNNE